MSDKLPSSFYDWLVDLRRQFHQFPELQYEEKKTSAKICEVLENIGVPFQKGIGETGLVARVSARRKGPVIAFRADMDALPLEEDNELPYKSRHQGIMHACGHDAHITIGLGIIRWLVENRWTEKGAGEILFIFQPAEEGGAGAKAMLDSGFFDSELVKAIFAGHVYPNFPVGDVAIGHGVSQASTTEIRIRLMGKGGHGAWPHQCNDPIVAGAYLVTQLQTLVSRNLPPLESAVLTIGSFHAGTASNIIPREAVLEGTLRTLNETVRENMAKRIRQVVGGVERVFDISAELDLRDGYPMMENHPELSKYAEACARDILGPGHVRQGVPSMGAEDFSYFCRKWGGVMVSLGCHDPQKEFCHGLHSPHFNLDERVLDVGVRLFSRILTTYLETCS